MVEMTLQHLLYTQPGRPHELILLTLTRRMPWQVDQGLPVRGCMTEYSGIREQMMFQITPSPGQPKRRAEVILMAEQSKILCSPVFSHHQAKQGICVTLSNAGKTNNLDFFFFCCPLEIYSGQHLQLH